MKDKKRGLGRGLNAILESPDTDITSRDASGQFVVGAVTSIPLDNIESNPFQPRDSFEEESLRELAESLKTLGIIQPVTVRKLGYDKYQLISGERRVLAARLAGMTDIPSFIRVANDQEMLEMALVENIQRKDLNPIQIAIAFQRLVEECNLTQEQLSNRIGKNRSTVTNYIRLLKLPPEIQIAIRSEQISMGHARALINIGEKESQLYLLHVILDKDLSVREVEHLVRSLQSKPQAEKGKDKLPLPIKFKILQESLSNLLTARIHLNRNNKGKGSVVISFDSDEHLEKILSHIH
jgi:ParB family chromosome partitioning protein